MNIPNSAITASQFKEIFESMYPRLYGYALKYLKEEPLAEDVVENVMLKLWERRERYKEVKNLNSYLYSMVRNAALDHLAKHPRSVRYEDSKVEIEENFNFDIIEDEVYSVLLKTLETLPDKCKTVFKLSCIQNYSYQEIADQLDISVNTVKSQRSRAVSLMKSKLKGHPAFLLLLAII